MGGRFAFLQLVRIYDVTNETIKTKIKLHEAVYTAQLISRRVKTLKNCRNLGEYTFA